MSATKVATLACNPATQRGVPTRLDVDAKGQRLAYTNGRTVVVGNELRDLKDPTKSVTYNGHTQPVTVARISPSGYFCASADVAGNVRVWDIAGTDQVLKIEVKALGGRITDLAWDGESKRIIAVGEGRERFGATFSVDTGSSVGEIIGTSKVINAVAIRAQRPFRAATASDDTTVNFFTGVPFKHDKTIRTHTKYVQDVRYAPSGDHFASVGSDGKLFVYDGKDGSTVDQADAHKGTIMACAWSADSQRIATAGADGSVRIWTAQPLKLVSEVVIGTAVDKQQNGIAWAGSSQVISLNLDGGLNVIDADQGKVVGTIQGPTKAITAGCLVRPSTLYTGSFDGGVRAFELPGGKCDVLEGDGPTGQVTAIAQDASGSSKVHISAWGAPGLVAIEGKQFNKSDHGSAITAEAIAVEGSDLVTASPDGVSLARGGQAVGKTLPGVFKTVSVRKGKVIYGGADKKLYLATAGSGGLESEQAFDDSRGEVLCTAFSEDGSKAAAGDSSGRVVLIDVEGKKTLVSSKWTAHTSRVNSLQFSPNSEFIVSGGLDESIIVWSVLRPLKYKVTKNTHAGGVTFVAWEDDSTVVSAGADGCVRRWTIASM